MVDSQPQTEQAIRGINRKHGTSTSQRELYIGAARVSCDQPIVHAMNLHWMNSLTFHTSLFFSYSSTLRTVNSKESRVAKYCCEWTNMPDV